MSTQGKIRTLFSDLENTEALFPTTKVKAISDDNGVGLDALLSTAVHTGTVAESAAVAPVNADTLGGRKASEYATQNYVASEIAKAQLEDEDVDLSGYATKDYAYDTASEAALTALANAKAYTDGNISTWVGDSTVASQIASAVATKAPAGYGLGGYGKNLYSSDDINNITANGWYSWQSSTPANAPASWSSMLVMAQADHYFQLVYIFGTDSVKYRYGIGGTWYQWNDMTPRGFAPASHTHSAGDVGALALDGSNALKKQGGVEGGQLNLEKPDNTSLAGNVAIDVMSDMVRIFENSHPYRGAFIDISECGNAVCSKIYHTNNKPTPAEIGAAPASHTHSAGDVGASPVGHIHSPEDASAMRAFAGLTSAQGNDFNNCTTQGFHLVNGYPNANCPRDGYGILQVYNHIYATQIFYCIDGSVWQRTNTSMDKLKSTGWTRVDAGGALSTSGGTMSGGLDMGGNRLTSVPWPSDTYDATNKSYVDTRANEKLSTSGGTMTGNIDMGWHSIDNLGWLHCVSGYTYGSTLPAAGNAGRVFFKKVSG